MALLTSTLEDDSGDEVKENPSILLQTLLANKRAEHIKKVKEQETRQALEGDKIFRIRRPAENAAK